jgi:hypothetical protein
VSKVYKKFKTTNEYKYLLKNISRYKILLRVLILLVNFRRNLQNVHFYKLCCSVVLFYCAKLFRYLRQITFIFLVVC